MRKVIKSDKKCGDCGGLLAFYKLDNGKYCPCNPDGSDHWDDCREAQVKGTYGIKRTFRCFISGAKTRSYAKGFKHLKVDGKKIEPSYYAGEKPPWDIPPIHCVVSQKHLDQILKRKIDKETISWDNEILWTDGKVTKSFHRYDI